MASETVNNITTGTTGITTEQPDAVAIMDNSMRQWHTDSLLPKTLLGGTSAMKGAGKVFLPDHTLESDTSYNSRLDASTLLNIYRKTTSFLTGQVFQSDIVMKDGIDPIFTEWGMAIDTSGNDMNVFCKRNFFNGVSKGMSYILIDMPKKDDSIQTVADEKNAGIRPYFKEINTDDMLGGIIDDSGFIVQLRIKETSLVRIGRFGYKRVKRVRVLEPGKWELHEEDNTTYTLIDSGTFSVNIIPVTVFIPGEEISQLIGETPLMDLAELNGKHWRSSSNQDNYLAYCRFPLYFGKHLDLAVLPMGRALINSEEDSADLKVVEMTGSSIAAGLQDIKETEAQMALYGLQQLIPRTGSMTATEKALTSAESNSSLGTWATEFESILIQSFKIAASFVGKEFPDDGLTVNKEYNFGVADPAELNAILKANEQGILSAQACFTEFRRRGVFQEHLSWDDMEDDMEQEKQDSIDMARMAGAAFGDAPGDGEAEGDNEEDV